MDNVLEVEINLDIKFDEKFTKNMPDDIKGRLLTTMTIACEKYKCHWTELTWTVKPDGVISVKRKNVT